MSDQPRAKGCSLYAACAALACMCGAWHVATHNAAVFVTSKLAYAGFEQLAFPLRAAWCALYAFAVCVPVAEVAAVALWGGGARCALQAKPWVSSAAFVAVVLSCVLLDRWIAHEVLRFADSALLFPVPASQWLWFGRCALVHWTMYAAVFGLFLALAFAGAFAACLGFTSLLLVEAGLGE